MNEDVVLIGWRWFCILRGEMVHTGTSYEAIKPEMIPTVSGTSYVYIPLYTSKESIESLNVII